MQYWRNLSQGQFHNNSDFSYHHSRHHPELSSFRPSDWSEWLSGALSAFGSDGRMSYSLHVKPPTYEEIKSVSVEKSLLKIDARTYDFLHSFARGNGLKMLEDCGNN